MDSDNFLVIAKTVSGINTTYSKQKEVGSEKNDTIKLKNSQVVKQHGDKYKCRI
jgi:hypothetical protein